MAGMRTRATMRGSDPSRTTTAARAANIAKLLLHECTLLLKSFREKENFEPNADGRLVSAPPASSQLDTRDKLWRLHSALEQCHRLLERAIEKEDEELGRTETGEYENTRRTVKNRLVFLLSNTRELLRAAGGSTVLTPSVDGSQVGGDFSRNVFKEKRLDQKPRQEQLFSSLWQSDGPTTAFELKTWVYRVFVEVEHWSKTAVTVLQELQSDTAMEPSKRSTRSARR
uniref:Ciliary neurotrophic factor n=1 Tax=Fundulus heteroclitus TaxID=8078 RepID=A0A3Q2QE80_FUNHE